MKIVIWGLGYVGTVSTACLGPVGTRSQRRRPNLTKVHAVASRRSVTKEPGLDRLISQAVAAEHLDATQNGAHLVPWADVSLICVRTSSALDGTPMLVHIREVGLQNLIHGASW